MEIEFRELNEEEEKDFRQWARDNYIAHSEINSVWHPTVRDECEIINQTKMSKEDKIKEAITDILWMAIRYADGRHTYAPSTVRRAVKVIKEVYPDFKIKEDKILIQPNEKDLFGASSKEDYLYDLVNQNKDE